MPFLERLERDTLEERQALLAAPIIKAALAGRVDRNQYIAFLCRAYHHVKHTVPLMMACGSRLGHDHEWLRSAMAKYIQEELGHQEWILSDISAAGGDADAVRHSAPDLDTELMVAYAYDTVNRRNPVGILGMVFVLEGTSVGLASSAARALQRCLDLPTSAFSYLISHGDLDTNHMAFFGGLVNRLEREDRDAVIHSARVIYHLYGNVLRGIPMVSRE
jgi:pyrroloquinoline quinone (PQQ) biosynthesis protein C